MCSNLVTIRIDMSHISNYAVMDFTLCYKQMRLYLVIGCRSMGNTINEYNSLCKRLIAHVMLTTS